MLGQLLDGRYKLVQVLGAGGFGQTFVAEDTKRPGNPVCVVKQLKSASSDPGFLETARRMFQSEAETLEVLGKKHVQIPQLLAYFEQDQEFYLVQEYVEGQTLSSELHPSDKWVEPQVIDLLKEVLSILAFVHQSGVIHRDVKPDNIIRRRSDNQVVLVDFGAVKQVRTQTTTGQRQMSATIAIGTPGYMPSEQAIGRPKLNSDIYALGIIAIQALTGLNPAPDQQDTDTGFRYDQNTDEIIWQDKVQASPGLMAVLTKMVKPKSSDRYASASEALQALEQLKFGYTPTVSASPQAYTPTVATNSPANKDLGANSSVRAEASSLHGHSVTANQTAMPTVYQPSRDSGLSKGLVLLGGGIASLAVAIGVIFALSKPLVPPTVQGSTVSAGNTANVGNTGGGNAGGTGNAGNAGNSNNAANAGNTNGGNAGNSNNAANKANTGNTGRGNAGGTGNAGNAGNAGNSNNAANAGNTNGGNAGNVGNSNNAANKANTGNAGGGNASGTGNAGNAGNSNSAANTGSTDNTGNAANIGNASGTANTGNSNQGQCPNTYSPMPFKNTTAKVAFYNEWSEPITVVLYHPNGGNGTPFNRYKVDPGVNSILDNNSFFGDDWGVCFENIPGAAGSVNNLSSIADYNPNWEGSALFMIQNPRITR